MKQVKIGSIIVPESLIHGPPEPGYTTMGTRDGKVTSGIMLLGDVIGLPCDEAREKCLQRGWKIKFREEP